MKTKITVLINRDLKNVKQRLNKAFPEGDFQFFWEEKPDNTILHLPDAMCDEDCDGDCIYLD